MMAFAMDVLDPAGDTAIDAKVLARRPAGLTGATFGMTRSVTRLITG